MHDRITTGSGVFVYSIPIQYYNKMNKATTLRDDRRINIILYSIHTMGQLKCCTVLSC